MEEALNGAMGKTFSGKKIRTYPLEKRKFSSYVYRGAQARQRTNPWCDKWAVVATIFEASEAVRRQVRLRDWCLVVVFDKKHVKNYDTEWVSGRGNKVVVILHAEDQIAMNNPFVKGLPWNHFGRKNVGYLYAIQHGATVIWDFDDDNNLKFWVEDAAPPGAPSIEAAVKIRDQDEIEVLEPRKHKWPTFNPYPLLGAPTLPCWPRGLPPDDIKEANCSTTDTKATKVRPRSIAVLQSLAEYQPDVDAVYRITQPIPFWFKRSRETRPLLVPSGVLTPYNAQATLQFEPGFFALYLPISVEGRVSDIWRSYFAQRLFWDAGKRFGFLARPLVVQDRNAHTNVADMSAEDDIYMKSKKLIEFLGSWKSEGESIVERMEDLWIALYERTYIEIRDVELMQLWLQSLLDIGYPFPTLKQHLPNAPQYPSVASVQTSDERKCKTGLTFWTSELHDGTRMDVPSALSAIGANVIMASHKGVQSPHPSALRKKGISAYTNLSPVLKESLFKPLTETLMRENFEFFKNDPKIAKTDAFLCSLPASSCELWMPFNKTIVFSPAHRYNLGRCTKDEYDRLNEHLQLLAKMDNPKHVIAAMSRYDEEYIRHYVGLNPLPLYGSAMFYTSEYTYSPTRKEILLISSGHWIDLQIKAIAKFTVKVVDELYSRWALSDLVKHRAVIYIPHTVVSFNMTEIYALSLPLFMPYRLGIFKPFIILDLTGYLCPLGTATTQHLTRT